MKKMLITCGFLLFAISPSGCKNPFKPTPIPVMPGGPGEPTIELTYIPPYNSTNDLQGRVLHVWPAENKVACWIFATHAWWSKPTFTSQLTAIDSDGTWSCDITTGGRDELATEIRAYLVTNAYNPPANSSLPSINGRDVLAVASQRR